MLFAVYMLPLGEIIRCHDLVYHCYADDTPLYVFFVPGSENPITTLNGCLAELQEGMSASWLRLNPDKTEVLIMTRLQHSQPTGLTLGGSELQNTENVRNIGVVLVSGLTIKHWVSTTIKSSFFHLKHIIPSEDLPKVIHAFVS